MQLGTRAAIPVLLGYFSFKPLGFLLPGANKKTNSNSRQSQITEVPRVVFL
jgi:hypothetical protein